VDINARAAALTDAAEGLVGLPAGVIAPRTTERWRNYFVAVADEQWDRLELEGTAEVADATARLVRLRERRGSAVQASAAPLLDAELPDPLPLTRRADWSQIVTDLRARLAADGSSPAEIDEVINALTSVDGPTARARLADTLSSLDFLDAVAAVHHTSLVGAALARGVARFNTADWAAASSDLDSECRAAEQRLNTYESALYGAPAREDVAAAAATAEEMADAIRDDFEQSAVQAAELVYDRDRAGLSLRFGHLLRSQLRGIAVAHLVTWVAGGVPARPPLARGWTPPARSPPTGR
jgi:hypothetical protein